MSSRFAGTVLHLLLAGQLLFGAAAVAIAVSKPGTPPAAATVVAAADNSVAVR